MNQKILGKSVRPLAGYCFIKLSGAYDSKCGLIHIPDIARARKVGCGEIVAWNPTDEQNRSFGTDAVIGWYAICHDYAKTPVVDGIFKIPIDNVLAICDESAKINGVSPFNGVERCSFCGPAKQGSDNSMILDYDGYCPRCGKNAAGDKKDQFSEAALAPFMR